MDAAVTIRRVKTRRERRAFVALPYKLYSENQHWVPPLRREQARLLAPDVNPFFEHGTIELFLAFQASTVVGRIAAIINHRHLEKYRDGIGFFGFFECVEQYDVARLLLDAATSWLRERGFNAVRGPTNPSTNETSGLLVKGYDRAPSIMMPYNPPFYSDYLGQYGFEPAMTMWAYYGAAKHLDSDRLRRGLSIIKNRHPKLRLRTLNPDRYMEEAAMLHRLYNESFADVWGHVPMTRAEFLHAAEAMRPFLDSRLVFCVEDDGEPIGFSLSLPNVNRVLRHLPDGRLFPLGLPRLLLRARYADISEVRTVLLGVLPSHRTSGVEAMLILQTIDNVQRYGYVGGELGWVMDDNVLLKNSLEKLGAVVDKKYVLYQLNLH